MVINREEQPMKYLIAITLCVLLAGCGSGESAATAAAVAASEARAAKAAKQNEQHIVKQLDQINRQEAQQRKAMDDATSQ